MNIFILSKSCKKSAKYYFNSHVSKIILEIAQLMSTAILSLLPTIKNKNLATLITNTAYRSTHVNHPFAIWMRTSNGNWNWGFKMATALHNEWKYRYDHNDDKMHKSYKVIQELNEIFSSNKLSFTQELITKFPQCMPKVYQHPDPVVAYRNYYMGVEKKHLTNWGNRSKPHWWK